MRLDKRNDYEMELENAITKALNLLKKGEIQKTIDFLELKNEQINNWYEKNIR